MADEQESGTIAGDIPGASDQVPAGTAENYSLVYDSALDAEVDRALKQAMPPEPRRVQFSQQLERIRDTSYRNRPANPRWTETMAKIGIGSKNVYWDDRSWGSNVPDPANPGVKFGADTGGDISSAAQGIQLDVNASGVTFNEEIINPRLRFQPTNIVNNFSPVIKKPPRWVTTLITSVVRPVLALVAVMEKQDARSRS